MRRASLILETATASLILETATASLILGCLISRAAFNPQGSVCNSWGGGNFPLWWLWEFSLKERWELCRKRSAGNVSIEAAQGSFHGSALRQFCVCVSSKVGIEISAFFPVATFR